MSDRLGLLGALLLAGAWMSVAAGAEAPLSKDALFDLGPDTPAAQPKPAGTADAVPASKDELFALEPAPAKAEAAPRNKEEALLPASKDALFEAPTQGPAAKPAVAAPAPQHPLRGFVQAEAAGTLASPEHWTKSLVRLELGSQGRLDTGAKWKLSGRVDYNPIFDLDDFYQAQVRDDQRLRFQLRETYLDFTAGDWDWRVGRQHIVWGEMVGLFFADVVSAKDLREFVLPDFQVLRIPQWAARAEYFKDDFHAEVVWIPFPSYDQIGKPRDFTRPGGGADFYPYPLPIPAAIQKEDKPGTSLNHGNFGVRLTQLTNGWDFSGFYYTSMNSSPTFYQFTPGTLTPRHDRIWQLGGTLAKDFRDVVLKAEVVYTDGRRLNLTNVLAPDPSGGVVKQNTLDWAVGLDFNPTTGTRVNTQLFQRYFFDHNPRIIPEKAESGVSLLVNHKLANNWEVEALLVHSLNRSDWMLRPKAIWSFQPNWKLSLGVDLFGGPPTGLFGQYDANDRAYVELRHDF
jgi:hypothetical protein